MSYPDALNSARPQRVLFVDQTAELGGGEIALLEILQRLDRTQFDPQVVLFAEGPLVREMKQLGVRCDVVPMSRNVSRLRRDFASLCSPRLALTLVRTAGHARRLAALIRARNVSAVYCNSLKADVVGGLAARLAGVPSVWHVRDRICGDYLQPVAASVFRRLVRVLPSRVVANSTATAETLGVAMDRIRVVYSGTDWSKHDVPPPNLPPRVIGIVGRITPWKGQDVFLRAAAQLVRFLPDLRFRVIGGVQEGDEPYAEHCRRLVDQLGLRAAVEFCGFRRDIVAEMAALDLVVHASTLPEPFGQVIVQAMALGRPVIVTTGGGAAELVCDPSVGLRVPPGDVQALVEAVRTVDRDPAAALARVGNARRRAVERFSIEQTLRGVEAVLRECTGRPAPKIMPDAVIT